jgi:putative hydrolase of HD superfamily
MRKEESVIQYYVLIAKLKDVIRTGWINNHIERDRVESVAEHVYSTQNLALAMYFTYRSYYEQKGVNLEKVILMLAVHELEEVFIGDIPMYAKTNFDKKVEGHKAVCKVLENLVDSDSIKDLIFEFDDKQTEDAKFAYHCDKMDCDIQARMYDEEDCFDSSDLSFSDHWMSQDEHHYVDDDNFMDIFHYIKNNKILRLK